MNNEQEKILKEILRELQDIKILTQENSDTIDDLVKKVDKLK